jgi:DNA invertase Pin-like site-specific DNA recombinase
MLIGYARVSQHDQSIDLQLDALRAAEVEKIFTDTASGSRADRPELRQALEFARPGDCIAVWRLDRLGRSLPHLIALMQDLERREIGFRSLMEAIDTTTRGGRVSTGLSVQLPGVDLDEGYFPSFRLSEQRPQCRTKIRNGWHVRGS